MTARGPVCAASLLLALVSPALTARAESLDLPTAIARALERNRDLVRAARRLEGNRLEVNAKRADFATRFQPGGSIGTSDQQDSWRYGLTASKKTPWGTEFSLGGAYDYASSTAVSNNTSRATLTVALEQPLFREFGDLVHGEPLRQSRSDLKTARRSLKLQRGNLVVDVVSGYESLIVLQRQVVIDRAFLNRMEKLARLTRARERQGRATTIDTLRVDLQRGQASSRLTNTTQRIAIAQRDFAELIGGRPDDAFELLPPALLELTAPPVEEAVCIALSNRLEYAQVLQDYDDRLRGVAISRRVFYPDLSLVSHYSRVGEGADASAAVKLDKDEWAVGLVAGRELNPARDRAQYGQSLIARDDAQEAIRITELTIAREVQQALLAHRQARDNVAIAADNARLAEGRARLAQRYFELGRADNFSVTDAEAEALQADRDVLDATAEAAVSAYRLKRALGTLLEAPADLRPPGAPARPETP